MTATPTVLRLLDRIADRVPELDSRSTRSTGRRTMPERFTPRFLQNARRLHYEFRVAAARVGATPTGRSEARPRKYDGWMARVLVGLIREETGEAADRILSHLDQRFDVGLGGEPWVEVIVIGVSGMDEARALVAEVAADADPDWHRYFRFGEA